MTGNAVGWHKILLYPGMRILIPFLPFILLGASCSQRPENTIAPSQLEEKIRDHANVLNSNQEENIFNLITSLEREAGSQVSIITVDSLLGESIDSFSNRKAIELQRNKNNPDSRILITVVVKNKEIFIRTDDHLQHVVNEEATSQIIREDMAPRFRKNRYGSGLFVAVSKIKKIFSENKEATHEHPVSDNAVIAVR